MSEIVQTQKTFQSGGLTRYISGRTVAVTVVVAVVVLILEATSGGLLLTGPNIGGALNAASELGLIAIGVTPLMIGGEFDLSVGQTFVASGMTFASLYTIIGIIPALILGLIVGVIIGLINGFITVSFGIPSFITSLGMYYIVAGVVLVVTGGSPVSVNSTPASFNVFAGYIAGTSIRWEVVWWLGLAIIMAGVLHRTGFGNHIFASGGAPQVARNVGVPVGRTKIILFVVCGVMAGFSGIVDFAHYGDIEPAAGSGLQLQAIAASVIGGTALFGGVGTVYGGVIGSFFLGILTVGLVLSGASTVYYEVFVGVVLVLAVIIQARTEGLASIADRLAAIRAPKGAGSPGGNSKHPAGGEEK